MPKNVSRPHGHGRRARRPRAGDVGRAGARTPTYIVSAVRRAASVGRGRARDGGARRAWPRRRGRARRGPRPSPSRRPASARGVVHVHTTRSDGSGTVDDVAAAAARAGLQFVVVTDHGDGTRPPLAPAYRSGVLVIDGVEISTTARTLPRARPGPGAVSAGRRRRRRRRRRAAARRLRRRRASRIRRSRRSSWRDWEAPVDGLEWFNLDSEWRDDSSLRLARALVYYPLRPVPSLGAARRRRRQHAAALGGAWRRTRRVIGLASVDAHARLGSEGGFDRAWVSLRAPGYETLFATAQVSVELDAALSGDAGARRGRRARRAPRRPHLQHHRGAGRRRPGGDRRRARRRPGADGGVPAGGRPASWSPSKPTRRATP